MGRQSTDKGVGETANGSSSRTAFWEPRNNDRTFPRPPLFRELGSDARELVSVVAFFPQGVNEENTDWLFPTVSGGPNIFDKFCILSLAYRTNGFVTILAPLRDYLHHKDPTSSLLRATKERYFSRFSAVVHPDSPGFDESRWIISEDVNVEHLLDIFTSIDANSEGVWDLCARFVIHLYWHKPRLITLGQKIEELPEDHPSKAQCLGNLSWLFYSVGNLVECKRLLTYALKLWRERGDDDKVAHGLRDLSETNRLMRHLNEGIERAKEASEIFERLGNTASQAECLIALAWLLHDDGQLDAAEEAASRGINLLPEQGEQYQVCRGHRALGVIYSSKGDTEKATHHLKLTLEIASPLDLDYQQFWAHFALAELFHEQGRSDDAQVHIELAKSYAINDAYNLGRAMWLQARFWCNKPMLEKAKSEASHAVEVFKKLGAAQDLEGCKKLLRWIEFVQLNSLVSSDESDADGELLETLPPPSCVNAPC